MTQQRVQLALNVNNLDEAVDYYSSLFGATVNKRKPGYANFAIDEPPLKLVLFESPDADERINHLGVEVFDEKGVADATARIVSAGIADEQEIASTLFRILHRHIPLHGQGIRGFGLGLGSHLHHQLGFNLEPFLRTEVLTASKLRGTQ